MKSFSVNHQLITSTIKPNKEGEETAAAEGIIDLIEDADESAANIYENLKAAIKKAGLHLEGLTSIGADNTNVNMENCYCHVLHNGVKWGHQLLTGDIEKFLMMAYAHFSRSAKRIDELKSYYEFYEPDFHVQKCIEVRKIQGLNEDNLFNEFTELKLTFEAIKKKEVPLVDQIQFFLSNVAGKEIHNSSTTTIRQTEVDEEVEEEPTKVIRSDQLWAMLLAINATPTPNMKKLISFLYSIPASNAYVEGIFSEMKHLLNDFRNQMTSDSVAAELQIRRNGFLSCTDMHKYLLSQKELLEAISSNH
ncbi:unnamed protein product, partial [Rotaria sordida]